ncbi:MAG: tetratricopeptide repeat protein [Myxococcota bacterium]|nr:tetratricopeptide repeat protein [Myxococcota bacterium]
MSTRSARLRLKYLGQRWLLGALAAVLPRSEWAHFHLGNAHAEHGHPERSEQPWQRACNRPAPRAAAALNLGSLLLERGAVAEAIPVLTRAAGAHPDHAKLQLLLGKAHQKAGALGPAAGALLRVVALEPENDAVRFTAALLLEKQGHKAAALTQYQAIRDPGLKAKAQPRIAALSATA